VLERYSPAALRRLFRLWPPFIGAGIRVTEFSADWHYARVELRLGRFNRNFVGTHFGGSLYAMTDPFYMIMLIQVLGPDYVVWDQSGEVEYLKPGRTDVVAEFRLDPHRVQRIREEAADGSKLLPEFLTDVTSPSGEVVARVRKKIYVRLKGARRPPPPPEPAPAH
jgi:acyl-coenzyme A thioesterase PaaI-like protein